MARVVVGVESHSNVAANCLESNRTRNMDTACSSIATVGCMFLACIQTTFAKFWALGTDAKYFKSYSQVGQWRNNQKHGLGVLLDTASQVSSFPARKGQGFGV